MEAAQQIEKFGDFLRENYYSQILEKARVGQHFIVIDFQRLSKFDHELAEEILDNPEEAIKAAEISLRQFDLDGIDESKNEKDIKIRFSNLSQSLKMFIGDIRSKHLNKFLSMDGVIRQKTDVRPQIESAKFECPSCGNIHNILQLDKKLREPSSCGCGRKGKFIMIHKKLVDIQKIILEESPEHIGGGDQPKKINIYLKEDLTSPFEDKKTVPGKRILVNGILKEVPIPVKGGGQSVKYDLCVEVNYLQPLEETFEDLKITEKQLEQIKKMAEDKDLFKKIVNSVAPMIEGHDKIKEAMALQMFGGVDIKDKKDILIYPGNIHILLIGDPGSSKSQLLLAMTRLCPKSRYVSGKGASGVGLTASVVKDEDFPGGYALAAGVIVLANGGVAMLDEFDKIGRDDTTYLHEAMAHQTIHISKASIQAILRAATSILAAANPKFSRFDRSSSVGNQITLEASLLNRFDLIFPIYDVPNEEQDIKVATKILDIFRDVKSAKEEIDPKLLRAYVSYAKNHIHPTIDENTKKLLTAKYIEIRTMYKGDMNSPVPINPRQLITMMKIAAASARTRLSNKIAKIDIDRSINILMDCLKEVGMDQEIGKLDIDRISAETSFSQRDKFHTILETIKELQDEIKSKIVDEGKLVDVLIDKMNWSASEIEALIERLKREGEIFEPRRGFVQLNL